MPQNRSLAKSFAYAFEGLKMAFREEPNFKIHSLIAIFVLLLAWFLGFSPIEWVVLILTIFLVMTSELINTAVEDTLNLVNPEISQKVKVIKDLMAAIVLLASVSSVAIGAFLFLPKILDLL